MLELGLSLTEFTAAFCIVVLGAFAQGVAGFGLALIIGPLLSIISPVFLPGPVVILAGVIAGTMVIKERKAISGTSVKRSLGGYCLGTIMAAALISILPQRELSLIFAALILSAVAMGTLGISLPSTRAVLFSAGTVGGFMGTFSGVGLPPLALALQNEPGPRLRGTLACVGTLSIIMSIVALVAINKLGWQEVLIALSLIPAVFTGFALSIKAAAFCDTGYTKPAVFCVSGLSAVALLFNL